MIMYNTCTYLRFFGNNKFMYILRNPTKMVSTAFHVSTYSLKFFFFLDMYVLYDVGNKV